MGPNKNLSRAGICLALAFLFPIYLLGAEKPERIWSAALPGEIKWQKMTQCGVLLASAGKSLYAIDAEKGQVLWSKPIELKSEELLEAPNSNILLYSLKPKGEKKKALAAIDLLTGDTVWENRALGDKLVLKLMTVPAKRLLIITAADFDLFSPRDILVTAAQSLIPFTGAVDLLPFEWAHALPAPIKKRPPAMARPEVFALDLPSGLLRWRYRFGGRVDIGAPYYVQASGEELFLQFGQITSLDLETGRRIWQSPFESSAAALVSEDKVYLAGREVTALERSTGRQLWKSNPFSTFAELYERDGLVIGRIQRHDPLISKLGFFMGVKQSRFVALDAGTGRTVWVSDKLDGRVSNMLFDEKDSQLVVGRKGQLCFINLSDGRTTLHNFAVRPLVLEPLGGDELLIYGNEGIYGYNHEKNRLEWSAAVPSVTPHYLLDLVLLEAIGWRSLPRSLSLAGIGESLFSWPGLIVHELRAFRLRQKVGNAIRKRASQTSEPAGAGMVTVGARAEEAAQRLQQRSQAPESHKFFLDRERRKLVGIDIESGSEKQRFEIRKGEILFDQPYRMPLVIDGRSITAYSFGF